MREHGMIACRLPYLWMHHRIENYSMPTISTGNNADIHLLSSSILELTWDGRKTWSNVHVLKRLWDPTFWCVKIGWQHGDCHVCWSIIESRTVPTRSTGTNADIHLLFWSIVELEWDGWKNVIKCTHFEATLGSHFLMRENRMIAWRLSCVIASRTVPSTLSTVTNADIHLLLSSIVALEWDG